MKKIIYVLIALSLTQVGCSTDKETADAYGNFEAIEVIVSAETQGKIVSFQTMEGEMVEQGSVVVVIDTFQLYLQKKQLETMNASIAAKIKTIEAQAGVIRVRLVNLEREKNRIHNLYEAGAATSKQQDDIDGQVDILRAQLTASDSQKASVYAERKTLQVRIQQVEDQIIKCAVKSPIDGIILTKYKEPGEVTAPGQPLFKIANMDKLILRAYISGSQLSETSQGKSVTVNYDIPGGMESVAGVVTWISHSAEFTPKIIQTREERINLVYAIKIEVPNSGPIKIGMPGEVTF